MGDGIANNDSVLTANISSITYINVTYLKYHRFNWY